MSSKVYHITASLFVGSVGAVRHVVATLLGIKTFAVVSALKLARLAFLKYLDSINIKRVILS